MKKSRLLIFGIISLIYFSLLIICINNFIYIEDIKIVIFWLITMVLNIIIIVFTLKKKLRFLQILSITIIFNFIILALCLFLSNVYLLKLLTIIEKIKFYLYCVFLVAINGNWLLPLMYFIYSDVMTRKEGAMYPLSKFLNAVRRHEHATGSGGSIREKEETQA